MKCPIDSDVDLQMTDRQGIEIDYCPKCRGVWLDRGELDKIIERSVAVDQRGDTDDYNRGRDEYPRGRDEYQRGRDAYSDREHYDSKHHRKKRGGFLGDLFDFD